MSKIALRDRDHLRAHTRHLDSNSFWWYVTGIMHSKKPFSDEYMALRRYRDLGAHRRVKIENKKLKLKGWI